MASNSLLAQNALVILTSLLSLSILTNYLKNKHLSVAPALIKAKWIVLLLIINFLWLCLQCFPLPTEILTFFSPQRLNFEHTNIANAPITFYAWQSKQKLLLSFAYIQLFVLALCLITDRRRLNTLLYTIVILGVFQASYGSLMTLSGIEQTLWFKKHSHIGFATGTLLNRNHLANYLTFACAAGIALLLSSIKNQQNDETLKQFMRRVAQWLIGGKGTIRICLIILVIGLILTRSRMGNTAFFISLTCSGFIWLALAKKFNKTTLLLFSSFLVIDIFLMGTWFGFDKLAERIENTSADTELRAQALPYLIHITEEFWISGVGAGNFSRVFPLYSEAFSAKFYNEAHLDYLQFIIEQGIIGFAPLLLIIILTLHQTLLLIRNNPSRLAKGTAFAVLMAMIASGLHATVEYNLQRPATASLFITFLALPWIAACLKSNRSRRGKKRKPSVPSSNS